MIFEPDLSVTPSDQPCSQDVAARDEDNDSTDDTECMSCFAETRSENEEEGYKNRPSNALSDLNKYIHKREINKKAESFDGNVVSTEAFQLIGEASASWTSKRIKILRETTIPKTDPAIGFWRQM